MWKQQLNTNVADNIYSYKLITMIQVLKTQFYVI